MKRTLRSTRILLALGLIALVSGAAYAFTAQNTVPSSWAGAGSGTINGWNTTGVSNIAYTLDAADPTTFSSVAFDLNDHAATDVKVQLNSSGGTWYDCGASGAASPYSVTCTITGESVQNADQLTVVALG
jgi:hypothetical protein